MSGAVSPVASGQEDAPATTTAAPAPRDLELVRGDVGEAIGETYPRFAREVLAAGA